ncbi:MAG: UDP-glucuronate 5-epimerase [Sphingomonadales bacterium CG12_big_fil_rev_8_21_14_0_65_65_10]|uniref:GDP-mannose 4,6-dehydratase n=1 Tax=Blastomonas marina TaxID=1867408 RepID=UPI000CB63F64|nr:GDP-mannose 4,6-dehydratase [Blastomonas marina]PIW55846.1 MAG: UDP-glucuronate 5-epimerase [Sphingomonadales bacterium CG12_big_fil_rev_8_21_14_0_65_65_10]WPZ03862.1 GDP-mannose 4,6-dehydratase [Blastomonas marina]
MRKVFITGSAGFIGFHLAQHLLDEGFAVVGYDGMTDYYDVRIKQRRHQMLSQNEHFAAHEGMLEDFDKLHALMLAEQPDAIVHLAAQAGVRYSLENPRAYLDSNLVGTFNVMECARELEVDHLLMASTSSVYGANEEMPFSELQKTDTPLTFYAATKKATEAMGHSYAHLWNLPTTMFRFFTVYGPWGRPDMALFKFTKGILNGEPIDIYNHGKMYRDFTYVTDLVRGIRLLIDTPPVRPESKDDIPEWDSLSPAAPYRVVNIGNNDRVRLEDFVDAIEAECGVEAKRNYMDIQKGDVPATWADATLLEELTGYRPQTDVREGIKRFVAWYREYYEV